MTLVTIRQELMKLGAKANRMRLAHLEAVYGKNRLTALVMATAGSLGAVTR
jgi:hypothetical protein